MTEQNNANRIQENFSIEWMKKVALKYKLVEKRCRMTNWPNPYKAVEEKKLYQ